MTNGQRGADFERKVRKHLEEAGYVVMRSTASKTPMDLAAFNAGVSRATTRATRHLPLTMLVQCKINGRLDHGEWNVLYNLAKSSDTYAVLARREWAGRTAVIGLYLLTGPKVPNSKKPPKKRLTVIAEPEGLTDVG